MTNNRSLRLAVACFLALAFTSMGYAAELKFWCHDEGYFEKLNDGRWEERSPGGTAYFVEKERTEKFIDLYDATRECYVRLFEKHCEVKFQKGKFTKLYDGTWRAKLPDFATRVDEIVAESGITAHTPGVAVLVLEHGKIAYRKCYGLAELKDKRPITPETTFELASCSKQFTGTAILLLYEQGKLTLNDDVRKYIPELPEYDKKNPIHILHLARQTSGLREYMDFQDVKGTHSKYLTNEDYVDLFARQHKKFPPYFRTGSNWRYTNTNFMLLALIVERVSKQSFGAFLRKEIFDPLGMKTATVYERPKITPHAAALGYHKDQSKFEETWGPPPFRHEMHLEVGDGAVWASLDDLARWNAGWRNGKILKPATIKLALVPSKYGDGQSTDYAFGWGVSVDKGELRQMSHNGSWGGFLTYVDRNVAEDRTLILLGNVDSLKVDAIVRTCRAMPPTGKE